MLFERVGESPNVVPIVSVHDGLELNALLSDKFRYGKLWSFLLFSKLSIFRCYQTNLFYNVSLAHKCRAGTRYPISQEEEYRSILEHKTSL